MNKKIQIHIWGISCINCKNKIEKALRKANGILNANVTYSSSTADISYDTDKISSKEIISIIEKLGYGAIEGQNNQKTNFLYAAKILIVILFLYILLQHTGLLNIFAPHGLADSQMGYAMLFIIGLITSVHCIAMCGGINLSQSISQNQKNNSHSSIIYNAGRIFSYALIGFILGLIGSLAGGSSEIYFSINLQGILKIIAGIFMVIMGLNMLNVFPLLRKFTIKIPNFFSDKKINNSPFVVGLLNGIMPCGPLQSMWIVALGCENPFVGALSMFLFGLGTLPLMLGLGAAISSLGKHFKQKVMTVGAVFVTVLGLAMFSQGWALAGFQKNTAQKLKHEINLDNLQIIHSTLSSGKYPDIKVQAGNPVKWIINAPKGSINGCNYKMLLQEYGIEHTFKTGENIINFIPAKSGKFYYSCWMGMIRGSIYVD